MPFVTQAKWNKRSDCGRKDGWKSADIKVKPNGKKDGVPKIKVRGCFGHEITIAYRDKGNPGKRVEIEDTATGKGKKFSIGSELVFEPMDAPAAIAFPDGTRWQPEFGLLKTSIILDAKPAVNSWDFDIELPKDADLHYQPALTAEEIARGNVRPSWCVGSYAVYDADACKVGHIPRSFARDAVGSWTWCSMEWRNKRLSITVPQAFLDAAVYPVVVDPNLGYDTIGGSEYDEYAASLVANDSVASATGTVGSLFVYLRSTGAAVRATEGIYTDNGATHPDTLIKDGAGITVAASPAVAAWYEDTLDTPASVVTGTKYWMALSTESNGLKGYYDAVAGYTHRYKSGDVTYAHGTLPATAPAMSSVGNYRRSEYGVITAAAAGKPQFHRTYRNRRVA